MTMLAWEANSRLPDDVAVVVPIDIIDIAAEANVRALAEDVPDGEETVQEETNATEEPTPAPAPTPAPTPPQQRRERNEEFDVAAASRTVNRAQEQQRRQREGERADQNRQSAGLGTAEIASLEGRIAQIASQELNRCWRSVADLPDPERLVVVVAIRLNRDGSLNGQPRVISPSNYTFDPLMNEAVNRALRAVRTCDPIERLPQDPIVGEHFNLWRDQEVRFGLRQ
jgi:hypothetical protein